MLPTEWQTQTGAPAIVRVKKYHASFYDCDSVHRLLRGLRHALLAVGMRAVQTKSAQINTREGLFAEAHGSDPQCCCFHSAVLADCLLIGGCLRSLLL